MVVIKKYTCLLLLILSCAIPKIANAEENDMFSVAKNFAKDSISEVKDSYEVIVEGDKLSDIINQKANEKYEIALNNKHQNDDNVGDSSDNSNSSSGSTGNTSSGSTSKPDKYPNQDSYFAGTTDFTTLSTSKRDAELNNWSAMRKSYDKYDDGESDNVTIIATAYTSAAEENGGYAGMNAIGGKLGPGCIAAPKDIPFQTKIRISGLGVFNVEDRGGAIVRVADDIIRIDVWMGSYREAMHFGKRVYKGRII